jgi:hypothetical protein
MAGMELSGGNEDGGIPQKTYLGRPNGRLVTLHPAAYQTSNPPQCRRNSIHSFR